MSAEVWGILNVTPDSFSDGGRYIDAGAAIAHARRMRAQGAGVIDIGGESTRPGASPIDPDEEQRRILPVVTELAREGIRVSVDTIHAATARAAMAAGAEIINDVTAGEIARSSASATSSPRRSCSWGRAETISTRRGMRPSPMMRSTGT